MKINIYNIDTEYLVATVILNEVTSNRIRKLISDWDWLGEYSLDDLIEDHILFLSFLQFDPYHYIYTIELTSEEIFALGKK